MVTTLRALEIRGGRIREREYRNRVAKGRDWAVAILEEAREREGQRLESPKLSMQNAPTKGSRLRSGVVDEIIDDSLNAINLFFVVK